MPQFPLGNICTLAKIDYAIRLIYEIDKYSFGVGVDGAIAPTKAYVLLNYDRSISDNG